jgi:hypothetical protein
VNVMMDFPGRFGHHHGDGWFPFVGFFGLLLLALAVVAVVLVFRGRRDHARPLGGPVPPLSPFGPHAPRADDALNHLRLRYARGEVSRDDFMRMSADLGAPLPAEPVPMVPPPEAPTS